MNYTVTDNHILTLKVRNHKKIRKEKNKYRLHWFNKIKLLHESKIFNTIEDAEIFNKSIIEDDILDITIENYLKLNIKERNQLYGFKTKEVNWKKNLVKIDPYILGMWLGDGLSSGFGFVTADEILLEYWKKWAKENYIDIKHQKKYQYGLSSTLNNNQPIIENAKDKRGRSIKKSRPEKAIFLNMLKEYNLVNNKHIPKEYLINDRDTRLKLLAGLIDTDGNVRANGHEIRICQGPGNTQIILDTLFLAQSLGFSCNLNDGISQWTHTFKDGRKEKRFSKYKELTITGELLHEIPTLLPRKKLNQFILKNSISRCTSYLQSPIQVIQKEFAPFVGWQLEGNGRFLLSDFTVVHNTPKFLGE
jgi:hypothetical protein